MFKQADDYLFPGGLSAPQPPPQLMVAPGETGQSILDLRAQAEALTQQLRFHEALRMSQTVENLGGPGSMRARYMRAVMANPYAVSPLMPYMQHGMMGQLPPGVGGVHTMPTELDMRAGEPDPEMTALEQGITHTASVRILKAMGRSLAEKVANEYGGYMPQGGAPQTSYQPYYAQAPYVPSQQDYEEVQQEEIPPQYAQAVRPPPTPAPAGGTLGAIKQHLGGAVKGLGSALGESALATGHAVRAVGGGLGQAAGAVAGGVRDFMHQDLQSSRKWGTGATPASFSNEFGQPVWG